MTATMGATPSDEVGVAHPDDLERMYLYRPSQLVVGGRSEGLVAEQLERFNPRVLQMLPQLDAVVFELEPGVEVPVVVASLLAEDDQLQVAPNHVFWQAGQEPAAPARIRVPGFGLRGRLLDAAPPDVRPPEAWSTIVGVRLVDGYLGAHPLFASTNAPRGGLTPPTDPYQPTVESHATAVLGALLLEAPVSPVEITAAVGLDGLIDELTLAEALIEPGHDVTCVPLGGFTHDDRPPVLLVHALQQRPEMLVVAAAGNHASSRPFWPAALDGAVGVAATAEDGRLARWSGRGPWVDRHAPGVGVLTAGPGQRWVRTSGTSIAAAVFTGQLLRIMGETGVDPRSALAETVTAPPVAPLPTPKIAPPDLMLGDSEQEAAQAGPLEAAEVATEAASEIVQEVATQTAPERGHEAAQEVEVPVTPPSAATLSATPGYVADTFADVKRVRRGSDPLDIWRDVEVLASVIASSRVQPPLSLGIFGDWGAGKSFLMNQVQLRVKDLSAASAQAAASEPRQETYYCRRVAQIDFNAWQYVGGQLWASLINRVFEGVREHLDTDEAYREVMGSIQEQDQHVQVAAKRLAEAEEALRKARDPGSIRTAADVAKENPELAKAVDRFASTVGMEKEALALGEVAARTRELGTLAGRFREGWALRGTGERAALAVVIMVGIIFLTTAAFVPGLTRFLGTIAGVAGPFLAVLLGILKPSGDALRAGVRILGSEEEARQKHLELEARYEAEKAELDRLRRAGPAGLYGFVEERYMADDYRKYLGMVPLIRQDLKRLSDQARAKDAAIERIVLYIDDLDRCPTRQVVNVLEAVNLLFGFPVFVVVIAVDSRWLVRSLETEFSAVFGGDGASAPSPQDYLEKIIQIPFWLRRMQPDGFGHLVSALLRPPPDGQEPPGGTPGAETGAAPSTETTPRVVVESLDVEGDDEETGALAEEDAEPVEPGENVDLTPDSLLVTDDELAFLKRLAPLVATPRATKRLVNTYQLVRVSVSDVTSFLAHAQHEPLLLLLALIAGSPGLSVPMARILVSTPAVDLQTFLDGLPVDSDEEGLRGWSRLRGPLTKVGVGQVRVADLRRWLPDVSRFSFRPGLADVAQPRATVRATSDPAPPTANRERGGTV